MNDRPDTAGGAEGEAQTMQHENEVQLRTAEGSGGASDAAEAQDEVAFGHGEW